MGARLFGEEERAQTVLRSVLDYRVQTTEYRLPTKDYLVQSTEYRLPRTDDRVQTTENRQPTT